MKFNVVYLGFLFATSISVAFAHGSSESTPKIKNLRNVIVGEQLKENTTDEKEITGKLVQKKIIDGFEFKLKVVDARESVPDGGSHNLLVNIKHNSSVQYGLPVTAKVDQPKKLTKSKSMMELGDWYLAGFDLGDENEYHITISFESADGVNHSSSINYP